MVCGDRDTGRALVSHKTPAVYGAILARHGVAPARFLMVGNSVRSDVLPVVEAGGWAVHVPAALSWSHEHADPEPAKARYVEVPALDQLGDAIAALERRAIRSNTETTEPAEK